MIGRQRRFFPILASVFLIGVCVEAQAQDTDGYFIETRVVSFDEIRSPAPNLSAKRVLRIDPPVDMNGVKLIVFDTMFAGLDRITLEGRASPEFGASISSGSRTIWEFPPSTGFLTGANSGVTLRLGFTPADLEGIADRIELTIGTRNPDGEHEAWLRPFPEVGGVTLHFVHGNDLLNEPGLHEVRFLDVAGATLDAEGTGPWQEYFFDTDGVDDADLEPVDGTGLRYAVQCGMGFSSSNAPATIESQLILEDGSFLQLDDTQSPGQGEPAPGILNTSSARLLDKFERLRLDGLEIVGWRFRIVTGLGGRLRVQQGEQPPPVCLVLLRDFSDCNENGTWDFREVGEEGVLDRDDNGVPDECEADCDESGMPDAAEIAAGVLEDCNHDGIADVCQNDCDENGTPDVCEVSHFATSHDMGASHPGFDAFLDAPDGTSFGVAGETVTLEFEGLTIVDGFGADFNLYEARAERFGGAEQHLVEVLVSENGVDFVSIEPLDAAISAPGVVAADSQFTTSFDIAETGLDAVRYVRLVDLSGQVPGETSGYDLDAVAAIHFDACIESGVGFVRGDGNSDGTTDLSDAIFILNFLFLGGEAPACLAAANSNGDGGIDIADPSYLLNHLFTGGAPPVAPFPACGPSSLEADATLGCDEPSCP